MFREDYINKFKDLPQSLRQFIGLIIITIIVIVSFSVLNGIFGQGDELVKKMKLEEYDHQCLLGVLMEILTESFVFVLLLELSYHSL